MNATATKPTLSKVEDHEGFGTCGECGREGLRWIATLSDGSQVGMECAKKVMGWKPTGKDYAWTADFRVVAEHIEYGSHYVLWQHKAGAQTRETRNGSLDQIGGVTARWTEKGWL